MKLIVGLGNPGDEYARTRHNIGFLVIRALSRRHDAALKKDRPAGAVVGETRLGRQRAVLALPQTYMNLSGVAVRYLMRSRRLTAEDILVVCDDMDLDFGRLKIRAQGSSGGHNGLESVIASLGSREFARLRVGIGRPLRGHDPAAYVLSGFSRAEQELLSDIVERAGACCEAWALSGTAQAMNTFNTYVKEETR